LTAVIALTLTIGVSTLTGDAEETAKFSAVRSARDALVAAPPAQAPVLETFEGTQATVDVTRTQAVDLLAMIPAAPAVPGNRAQAAKPRDPGKLSQAEITRRTAGANLILQGNKLRMLREAVLAGIYKIEAIKEDGFRKIKLRTVNAELSQRNLTELLTRAAAEGRIELPPSLSTTTGGVDMDTLLFHLVQASLATDGTTEGTTAALEMTRRAFAAAANSTTTAKLPAKANGIRTYVVEPGDSHAYISLQFYGKPDAFDRIFQANRDTLQSPELIRIGQRLKIPS